jgi:hypothetical protein
MHMASLAMMQEASVSLGKENKPWNNKGDSHNNSSHINSSDNNHYLKRPAGTRSKERSLYCDKTGYYKAEHHEMDAARKVTQPYL